MNYEISSIKYKQDLDNNPPSSKSGFYLPARYVLILLLFFGTCVSYFIRTDMSLTIVAMVKKTPGGKNCTDWDCGNVTMDADSSCPNPNDNKTSDDGLDREGPYTWDSKVQGVVLGGFFYGYTCTQVLMGRLADKLGPRCLVGVGMFLGSAFTVLVPLAADWGVGALITLRVLTGMSQGVLYPCLSSMFVKWIPEGERSLMYCICGAGSNIGIILCMPVVGWLCQSDFAGGWPAVFYLLGGSGCVWSVLWMIFAANDPSSDPRISPEELEYILKSIPPNPKELPVPWKEMLTSVPVWSYVFTFSCSSWIYYTRLTELPNYLNQVLHSPLTQNGYINAVINIVSLVFSLVGGYAADQLLLRNLLSKSQTRKLMECCALFGSLACLMGVILSGCNATAVITLLNLAAGFSALANSGDSVLAMDMAPALAGTVFGIANTICSTTGFISPLITGVILDSPDIGVTTKWDIVFYMSVGIGVAGGLGSLFFWSAEVQTWDPSYRDVDDRELIINDTDQNQLTKPKPADNNELFVP